MSVFGNFPKIFPFFFSDGSPNPINAKEARNKLLEEKLETLEKKIETQQKDFDNQRKDLEAKKSHILGLEIRLDELEIKY